MSKDWRYVVYRHYSEKEQADPDFRNVLYGWSYHKSIVKLFLKQRDPHKYHVTKLTDDEIYRIYSEEFQDTLKMIDVLYLPSSKLPGTFCLYMTQAEVQSAEKRIQMYIHSIPSLDNFPHGYDNNYLELFINFIPRYSQALDELGYRIPDLDIMYPSEDYHDDPSDFRNIEEQIDKAYSMRDVPRGTPAGLTQLGADNSILYSLEAFVKVLAEDM